MIVHIAIFLPPFFAWSSDEPLIDSKICKDNVVICIELIKQREQILLQREKIVNSREKIASEKAEAYETALNQIKYWISGIGLLVIIILFIFGFVKNRELADLKKEMDRYREDFFNNINLKIKVIVKLLAPNYTGVNGSKYI